ncbi:MAG: hypothetical protein ACUVQM_06120 [Candidatus Hadarchaeaceae archaeon]
MGMTRRDRASKKLWRDVEPFAVVLAHKVSKMDKSPTIDISYLYTTTFF